MSQVHTKDINRLCLNKDRTLLLTCSKDYNAKLLDANTLQASAVLLMLSTFYFGSTLCFSFGVDTTVHGEGQHAAVVYQSIETREVRYIGEG